MTATSSGTLTPLPLTTTFKPPSACLTDLWAAHSAGSTWMNLGPLDTARCLPSGWSPSSTFSPGVCPSGWIMASNLTTEVSNKPVTVGTCCPKYLPSGWVLSTRPSGESPRPWHASEICQWSPTTNLNFRYMLLTEDNTELMHGTMTAGGVWNAYGIVVEWQSSDHIYLATATATTTSSEISTQHVTSTSSGLSSNAKAGIGVGVAIGAISILLAFGLLIWRRRKRPKTPRGPLNTAELDSHSNYEMSGTDKLELDSNPLHEAGGLPKTHSSTQELVELDGTH